MLDRKLMVDDYRRTTRTGRTRATVPSLFLARTWTVYVPPLTTDPLPLRPSHVHPTVPGASSRASLRTRPPAEFRTVIATLERLVSATDTSRRPPLRLTTRIRDLESLRKPSVLLTTKLRLMRLSEPRCSSRACTTQRHLPSRMDARSSLRVIVPRPTSPRYRQPILPSGLTRRRSTREGRTTFARRVSTSATPSPLGEKTANRGFGA